MRTSQLSSKNCSLSHRLLRRRRALVVGRKETPFNNPFASLGKTLKKELEEKAKPAPPPPKPKPKPKVEEKSDEATFLDAMRGIDRLDGDTRGRAESPP